LNPNQIKIRKASLRLPNQIKSGTNSLLKGSFEDALQSFSAAEKAATKAFSQELEA
jgi:hypothetical protein